MAYSRQVDTFERSLAWGLEQRRVPRAEAWVIARRIVEVIKARPGDYVDEAEAMSLTGDRRVKVARVLRDAKVKVSPERLYVEAWVYDDKLPAAGGVRLAVAWFARDPGGSAELALARASAGARSWLRARLTSTLAYLSALFVEGLG